MTADATAPLAGVRVIDCSLLSPGATAAHLADLGAEVIKVEAPGGDYVRSLTWPIIEGDSLLHHHVSRGKKSPWRVHVLRPCFWYYQAFPEIVNGGLLADAIANMSSLNVIAGELDC